MLIYLFGIPLVLIVLSMFLTKPRHFDLLIVLHALVHFGVAIGAYYFRNTTPVMDNLGLFTFSITSVLYFTIAIYRYGQESKVEIKPYRIHSICLMIFVMAMDAACISTDLGFIWIFVEMTTLASAMLIGYEHKKSALEAAWKYLFICSTGIALAFVGILLLVIAQPETATLKFPELIGAIHLVSPFWLRMSFVFIIVGFGTKIGLAPLHFWLPDAHSEAPAPISALLSGALLNTALIPVLRMDKVMTASGLGSVAQSIYLLMGFVSVFIATVFTLKTKNYKRLLAYSSIENMGIIMLAFGTGGIAIYAGYTHILGHSLIKGAMFLCAGNIISLYKTKIYNEVDGLLSKNKTIAWTWLIGFAMLVGFPPSPLFFSEFFIAVAMLQKGNYLGFVGLFIMLTTIMSSMGKICLGMCLGESQKKQPHPFLQIYMPVLLLFVSSISVMILMMIRF